MHFHLISSIKVSIITLLLFISSIGFGQKDTIGSIQSAAWIDAGLGAIVGNNGTYFSGIVEANFKFGKNQLTFRHILGIQRIEDDVIREYALLFGWVSANPKRHQSFLIGPSKIDRNRGFGLGLAYQIFGRTKGLGLGFLVLGNISKNDQFLGLSFNLLFGKL